MNYFFCVFALLIVFFCFSAILLKNPVHSVLSLIAAFLSTSALFVLFNAEFIAMALAIVYVGAIAILFLFVVMMLNITNVYKQEGFVKKWLFCISLASVLLVSMWFVVRNIKNKAIFTMDLKILDLQALSKALYVDYLIVFEISGVILLCAMIGSISLTLKKRLNVQRQSSIEQVGSSPNIKLVKLSSGKGVNVYDEF